jgi:segregation and condensation protein B
MENKEIKSVLEAIFFIAGEPLSIDTLKKILEMDGTEIERLVRELIAEYTIKNMGLLIAEVAGGIQMVTNPACAPWVKKLLSTAVPTKLSQPSLETLAIIAYKQPIIKAEIEAIRGVNSDGVVKTLLDRRLVKILGRKEVPGRPLMYGTTKEFLQYFGLKDLSELPTLKEFQEVDIPEAPANLPDETVSEESFIQEHVLDGASDNEGQNAVTSNADTEEIIVQSESEHQEAELRDEQNNVAE